MIQGASISTQAVGGGIRFSVDVRKDITSQMPPMKRGEFCKAVVIDAPHPSTTAFSKGSAIQSYLLARKIFLTLPQGYGPQTCGRVLPARTSKSGYAATSPQQAMLRCPMCVL